MTKIDIYDISAQKFEELAFNFLQEQGGFTTLENLTSRRSDAGYDFSATTKDQEKTQKIAIEAKHRRKLYRDWETDRKSTRLNSSHSGEARMPSSA